MDTTEKINYLVKNNDGKPWEKNGYSRVYFNPQSFIPTLEVAYYKTGNISSAYIGQSRISNSEAGRILDGKYYYDAKEDKFYSKTTSLAAAADFKNFAATVRAVWESQPAE